MLVLLLIEQQLSRCSRRHSYGKQQTLTVIKPNASFRALPVSMYNSSTIQFLVSCDTSNLSSSFSADFASETSCTVSLMSRKIALNAIRNHFVLCKSIDNWNSSTKNVFLSRWQKIITIQYYIIFLKERHIMSCMAYNFSYDFL